VSDSALVTRDVAKRYRDKWALKSCDMDVPVGCIAALIGPNGAGKTTLLQLAAGLIRPTSGEINVLGSSPHQDPAWLAQVGFLAQDVPLYRRLTGNQLLGMGAHLNPSWNENIARDRLEALDIPLEKKVSELSGGERAQVGLALTLGKQPKLLLLDEPVASLDPLARRNFLSSLTEAQYETDLTVVLSSHLVADIERVCDFLVLLSRSRVQLVGRIDDLLAAHRWVSGPRRASEGGLAGHEIISERHTERQSTYFIRINGPIHDPRWEVADVGLEEMVLEYMERKNTDDLAQSQRRLSIVESRP
jgi:ABC-2 type transport system ATP-binding protein